MVSRPWFRLYHEFAADPKVQVLAFEDQRHYIMVLCLKCAGTLDDTKVSPELRDRVIAKGLGLDPVTATEARRRLVDAGLIDAQCQPIAWSARQYDSDTSAERTRKYRERKEKGQRRAKRHGDGSATSLKRHGDGSEQSKSKSRDPPTPTPSPGTVEGVVLMEGMDPSWPEARSYVEGLDAKAWAEWVAHRRRIGKRIRNVEAAQRKLVAGRDAEAQRAAVAHSAGADYQGLYDPDPPKNGPRAAPEGEREAKEAWVYLRAHGGQCPSGVAHKALRAIGGWHNIGSAPMGTLPRYETEFITAYRMAKEGRL